MEIGERLREVSGEGGFIARLGGDEFTLVFPLHGPIDEIDARASRLVGGFQRPLRVEQREIAIGVSCGAAVYPDHGADAASLLRAADTALFRAKELGRNRLCLYNPDLLVAASNRFRIEQSLRKAIEGGDFVLHYQPQVCLGRQRATGVEALLRWQQSDSRIIPAGEFVMIAEQSGLMLDLNSWVLEQASRDLREWRARGWSDARVAINVSAQQFMSGDFLGEMERLLARHDIPPDGLELELTENMLQTGAITIETLRGLRMLGVATALDDFGTGYSSLTSLEPAAAKPREARSQRRRRGRLQPALCGHRAVDHRALPQPGAAGDGRGRRAAEPARLPARLRRRVRAGVPGRTPDRCRQHPRLRRAQSRARGHARAGGRPEPGYPARR